MFEQLAFSSFLYTKQFQNIPNGQRGSWRAHFTMCISNPNQNDQGQKYPALGKVTIESIKALNR